MHGLSLANVDLEGKTERSGAETERPAEKEQTRGAMEVSVDPEVEG